MPISSTSSVAAMANTPSENVSIRAVPVPTAASSRAARTRLPLEVEPGAAGAGVAEPLAPGRKRLAGVRDGDLAVVAVDLAEALRSDIARCAGRGVADADGRAPPPSAVARLAIPDVPGILVVAAGRLHVPDAGVARPRAREPRPGRVLADGRERYRRRPGSS